MNLLEWMLLVAWSCWALGNGINIGSNKAGFTIKGIAAMLLATNPFTYVGVFIGAFFHG
jgi:hypothetical protein